MKTGDFRSQECIELLKEADIVVTNPPFSLFREYIGQLMEYQKKFLIIGRQYAITYKEVFPLFVENKVWLGYGFKGAVGHFASPYEDVAKAGDHRENMIRVSGVYWYTNLDIPKRREEMDLVCRYSSEEYPKYANYDAIEVAKSTDIPYDYNGLMGVPITFMDKFNPEQFELVGQSLDLADMSIIKKELGKLSGGPRFYVREHGKLCRKFERIVIRNKHPQAL